MIEMLLVCGCAVLSLLSLLQTQFHFDFLFFSWCSFCVIAELHMLSTEMEIFVGGSDRSACLQLLQQIEGIAQSAFGFFKIQQFVQSSEDLRRGVNPPELFEESLLKSVQGSHIRHKVTFHCMCCFHSL